MSVNKKTHAETIAEIRVETEAEFRKLIDLWITQSKSTAIEPCERLHAMQKFNNYFDRLEAAHKREITILRDALAEVVASIEVRFPVIEYALDRKPYLDAKKILEQYK